MSILAASDCITVTVRPSMTAEPVVLMVSKDETYDDILSHACITASKNSVFCDGEEVTDLTSCPGANCELVIQPKKYISGAIAA